MKEPSSSISSVDRKARLALPPQEVPAQAACERRHNWDEVCVGFSLRSAQAEASRCLQCPAAPCQRACPLHNDIPAALRLLEAGDVIGAADQFRRTSPMPEVCGRVCPQERLCEGSCVVGKRGVPVRIGQLERVVADYQRRQDGLPPIAVGRSTGKSVAIIGAGPAGLAAAEELRRLGHRVVLFDAWPEPGGLLRYGIPTFKLPRHVVVAKIAQLAAGGVEFVRSRRIHGADGLAALRARGFDAILLAAGAGVPRRLNVPGEDLDGVWTAAEFLFTVRPSVDNLPKTANDHPDVGGPVVVIGGGDTAMDCCRSALRLGVTDVLCLYRRTEAEMPGRSQERTYAREEGVRFEFSAAPVRLLDEGGRVVGVECVRTSAGEHDASGQRPVVLVEGSTFTVPARTVVVAAGYHVDRNLDELVPGVNRNADGTVAADAATGATNLPGIFAAGDVVRGPDLVVRALADGRRVAEAIHAYLAPTTAEPAQPTTPRQEAVIRS